MRTRNPPKYAGLTGKQHKAIELRAKGLGLDAIAQALGKDRHTISAWMSKPSWASAWESVLAETKERATRVLMEGAVPVSQRCIEAALADSAVDRRMVLQAVGVLQDNQSGAHVPKSMADMLNAVQVNVSIHPAASEPVPVLEAEYSVMLPDATPEASTEPTPTG
jgi:hypothetical protein